MGLTVASLLPAPLTLFQDGSAQAAPELKGHRLILEDNFDGTSLDLTKWQVGTTPNDRQWGSDSYFVTAKDSDAGLFQSTYLVKDGMLTIRAIFNPDFVDPTNWKRKWRSGMIATAFADGRKPSAAFRRGYVEVRQKFPAGKGVWPANWACNLKSQAPGGDPLGTVEIDGLEAYGVDMTIFHTTVHLWKDKEVFASAVARDLPDLSADFHTYGYLIGDDAIEVFLDGQRLSRTPLYRADNVDKFFWMFNLAMGGGWPIETPLTGYYDMQIDYIKIYSADADAQPVAAK